MCKNFSSITCVPAESTSLLTIFFDISVYKGVNPTPKTFPLWCRETLCDLYLALALILALCGIKS